MTPSGSATLSASYPHVFSRKYTCQALKIRHPPDGRIECAMADDTTKRDYRDRDRINIHEDYELRYWTKELGVTPEKLKQTVEKVGVIATEVRKALGK
jgi:Protein of unknown function (DUF3606)